MSEVATEQKGPKTIQLSISNLLADLKAGISRKNMAKKYEVTQAVITEAFKNPKLKGKRVIHEGVRKNVVRKKFNLDLIDDTEPKLPETQTTETTPEVPETQTTQPETAGASW